MTRNIDYWHIQEPAKIASQSKKVATPATKNATALAFKKESESSDSSDDSDSDGDKVFCFFVFVSFCCFCFFFSLKNQVGGIYMISYILLVPFFPN